MRSSANSTIDEQDFDAYDDFAAEDLAGEFELTCPSCDQLLSGDAFYEVSASAHDASGISGYPRASESKSWPTTGHSGKPTARSFRSIR